MQALICFCFCLFFLSSCSDSDKQKGQSDFTLFTGVSVLNFGSCSQSDSIKEVGIKKNSDAYIVTIEGTFSCELDQLQPYLTLPLNRRATLVLDPKVKSTVFKSNCECNRSLIVRLAGRVERGDSLYVLHDSEVLGHVVLP